MSFLTDGHQTIIAIASTPSGESLLFREKEVTPPGVDGGGGNDVTNMRNEVWRTFRPKKLKTLTECSFTAHYDPAVYDQIVAMAQINTQITVTFSDGSTILFWGWLDKFVPNNCAEGAAPDAAMTIICSNQNNSDEEVAPVYSAVA